MKWALIILIDLTKLIVSDKLFLDIQLIHSFMPNLLRKSWMVSNGYVFRLIYQSSQKGKFYLFLLFWTVPFEFDIKYLVSCVNIYCFAKFKLFNMLGFDSDIFTLQLWNRMHWTCSRFLSLALESLAGMPEGKTN